MRRKDSGSIGDDDGSSVKSVESVGKEEKKVVVENKNQTNKPRELRKTSSSGDLQDERRSPALKKNDDEKADHREKDKVERKSSVTKDAKEIPTEKQKTARDLPRQKRDENRETAKAPAGDRRDYKKHVEDQEKRPERKPSESRPRSDEAFGKKSHHETDEFYDKADHESRKENLEKRGNRLSSKSERGSSESVRSRDSTEKRKDDRRRPDDIKRKRDDFEKIDKDHGNRDRPPNRDRLPSRGRGTVTVKSHLRGHPRSYSHGRSDRTTTQRHNRVRNDSKDYADDEIKTGADDEKSQVNVKMGERKFVEGDRRKPDSDRRHRDDDRRQQDGKQHYDTDKRYRDGERRNVDREKREPDDAKQQTGDRRRKDYSTTQFYDSSKQRDGRDNRDEKSFKKGQPSRTSSSKGPVDRAERFRDKTKNSGGFGVPPKKSDSGEKSKDETWNKTKIISDTTGNKKPIDKESGSSNEGKASNYQPPLTDSWCVSESRDAAKEVKPEEIHAPKPKRATEMKMEKPAATDVQGKDKQAVEKEVEKPSTSATIVQKQVDNKEDKPPGKNSQNESKPGEKRERTVSNKENKDEQNFKSDSNDTKVEKRRETERYGESRRRHDSKFDDDRPRQRDDTRRDHPKRNDERKAPAKTKSESWDDNANARVERKGNRDGTRQVDRTQEQSERRNDASYRDRKEHRDQDKSGQRNRGERSRTDPRERTDRRDQRGDRREGGEQRARRDNTEQRETSDRRDQRRRSDRRDRTDQNDRQDRQNRQDQRERTDNRDRTDQADRPDRRDRPDQHERADNGDRTEQSERADRQEKPKTGNNETNSDKPRKPDLKGDEQTEDTNPKEDPNKESKVTEKFGEDLAASNKQCDRFTMGTVSPVGERRRNNDTRRGNVSGRRGGRGGMRGRGRGRLMGSGRSVGRDNTAPKDDDENDSDDYHSANSSVESDETEAEEVADKPDERRKDDRRPTRPLYSSSRARGSYSSRGSGRGRGSSQLLRNTRKQPEKPPRFQRQEARGGSRGRGKSTRGGLASKENWDENLTKIKDSDEGPLPKKRPTDLTYSYDKDNDSSYRGRKTTRGGHSGNRNSFLAKKQQEVVEGSSRKGGGHFGAKSTIPAALTTHGRRGKNEPASADGDENLEPPKKNPRRTEPQKVGIEHIDLSNIAGFIDIDDIAQPANEFEPASPQSDFVEVKSKRTQKEQRERAREEEKRNQREVEKMMLDAVSKPKGSKSSQNKQHSTSKPPRFSRNMPAPSNVVSTLPEGNTPPRGATPVASPENSAITALPSASVEQKRVSPLMLEKPSSPPPPPMFNAWTKPLSITPAKPPNETSVDSSRVIQPDPLAVGSGKPQRASGAHTKAEEPGLQIQLDLPDTFQAIPGERDIDSQSSESRMFSRVDDRDGGEPNVSRSLKKTGDEDVAAQTESKKTDSIQSVDSNTQKEKGKMNTQSGKTTDSTVHDKISEHEKRQPSSNNWKNSRPPRFEKSVPGKRNTDGRKSKADTKDINGEPKQQPDIEKPKEVKTFEHTVCVHLLSSINFGIFHVYCFQINILLSLKFL